jgi:hypothetical protein
MLLLMRFQIDMSTLFGIGWQTAIPTLQQRIWRHFVHVLRFCDDIVEFAFICLASKSFRVHCSHWSSGSRYSSHWCCRPWYCQQYQGSFRNAKCMSYGVRETSVKFSKDSLRGQAVCFRVRASTSIPQQGNAWSCGEWSWSCNGDKKIEMPAICNTYQGKLQTVSRTCPRKLLCELQPTKK